MARHGYVLLCGHGRHQDGRLLRLDSDGKPAKEPTASDQPREWGRFPSEDVGERLLEQLAFAGTVRLVHIGVADTPEAQQTAHVLYERLSGRGASSRALRNVSRPPRPNFTVDYPRWAALLHDSHDAPEPPRGSNDAPVASTNSSCSAKLPYPVPWETVRGLTPIFD